MTPVRDERIQNRCQLLPDSIQSPGGMNIVEVTEGSGAGKSLGAFTVGKLRDDVHAANIAGGFFCLQQAFIVLTGKVVFTQNDVWHIRVSIFDFL